jgi:hypothetical protein
VKNRRIGYASKLQATVNVFFGSKAERLAANIFHPIAVALDFVNPKFGPIGDFSAGDGRQGSIKPVPADRRSRGRSNNVQRM